MSKFEAQKGEEVVPNLGRKLRSMKNTFVPVPVTLKGRRVNVGATVFEADARPWIDESVNKVEWYSRLDDLATELLREVQRVAAPDDDILDICCNVGRHLNELSLSGYKSLMGFDIMRPAIEQSKIVFPSLAESRIEHARADEFLSGLPSGSIDWAYSHTATVELIHPWFRIHRELFRIIRPGGGSSSCSTRRGTTTHENGAGSSAGRVSLKSVTVRSAHVKGTNWRSSHGDAPTSEASALS